MTNGRKPEGQQKEQVGFEPEINMNDPGQGKARNFFIFQDTKGKGS